MSATSKAIFALYLSVKITEQNTPYHNLLMRITLKSCDA